MIYQMTKQEKVDAAKRYYQAKVIELEPNGSGKATRRLKRLEMYRKLIEREMSQ